MGVFTGLILSVEAFVATWGLLGTFIVSMLESFIFPIPTAAIIAPMTALGVDPLTITIVATAGSVMGAVIGYYIGRHLGRPIAVKLFKKKRVDKVEKWFDSWGSWAIFIAAFTPIPFKVFAWAGGIFDLRLKSFLLASIAGRFLQFFIAAYLGSIFGPSILAWFGGI